jgi:hypothetical protein
MVPGTITTTFRWHWARYQARRGEGYVTFRIRPIPGTAVGSKIFNDADIFFVQNNPIVTPTTEHTIFINYTIFADGFE